jgi:hypothetical protein
MSLSLFGQKEKVSLLVNIGSGAISAGLVAFAGGQKPTIIYGTYLPFKIDDSPEKNKLVGVMDSLLGQTLGLVVKEGFSLPYWKGKKKHISSALVSFSSPWFASKIKNIELKKDKAFIVSNSFIDSISESEKKIFAKELKTDQPDENSSGEILAIEKIFTDFKINGYSIENCLGQKTKNFSASLYISAVPKSVADIVHGQLSKNFSLKAENISMKTFPFVSFVVAENLFPALSDFLLVDITAEMTDIVLVNKKSIAEVVSFPSGRNFIIRQIGKKFAVSSQIAESILRIYNAQKSDEETIGKMKEVLSNVEKEWSIYFENAFTELSKNMTLPSVICLTAGADVADLYSDFFKLPKDDQTAEFRKNVQVFHLDASGMSHLYNAAKFKPNIFLSVLTIFSDLSTHFLC